jgi:hypothetical protein
MITHRVGDLRATPKGALKGGRHSDTRLRYMAPHETIGQWFIQEIIDLLRLIKPRKSFLKEVDTAGGQPMIIV